MFYIKIKFLLKFKQAYHTVNFIPIKLIFFKDKYKNPFYKFFVIFFKG